MNAKRICHEVVLSATLSFCGIALCSTWYVDGSASSPGDGTTWETAFATIQQGIDAASDGDTVIVAEGTYLENIHFHGKNIILTSTDPLNADTVRNTIIDGNKSGPVVTFEGTEDETCVLSGFTIQNGSSEGWPDEFGGGILGGTWWGGAYHYGRATIRKNVISGNSAYLGGGLAHCNGVIQENRIVDNRSDAGGGLHGCNGPICANVIANNKADSTGGGLDACTGTISGNTIAGNRCTWGGGGLSGCHGKILGNVVVENDGGNEGGGLSWCGAVIRGNRILGNRASVEGGGLSNCSGLVQGNVIAGNGAFSGMGSGGGLAQCTGQIYGNLIVGNVGDVRGGGLASCSGPISNNTVAMNEAEISGGGFAECQGSVVNCIIWGNRAADGAQLYDSTTPTFCCVEGWEGDSSNMADDPLFVGSPLGTGLWTAKPAFDPGSHRTIMVDNSASWEADSLKRRLVNLSYPSWDLSLPFFIESNTATTITVWGDASSVAHSGDSYEIYDYHLHPVSPCVDAGDNSVDVGRFDLDGDYRRICTTGKPGWSGAVDYIVKDEGGAVTLLWKGFIDMGAYECQVLGDVPETFTISTRESMDSGDWIEVFTGNVCTWADLQATGRQKFYRVEMK